MNHYNVKIGDIVEVTRIPKKYIPYINIVGLGSNIYEGMLGIVTFVYDDNHVRLTIIGLSEYLLPVDGTIDILIHELDVSILLKGNMYPELNLVVRWLKLVNSAEPIRPRKPMLSYTHTVGDVLRYSELLDEWTRLDAQYKIDVDNLKQYNRKVDSVIEEFIKQANGFYNIPEQYQTKVWELAWNNGHAYGWIGVQNHLVELIEIFE